MSTRDDRGGRAETGTVVVIPARGGSKGIPGKNLRPVGGVPLIVRAVRAAAASKGVERIVVSTDDDAIAHSARSAGAEVVSRPAELAGDTASSESAVIHALEVLAADGWNARAVVLVQATSPLIDPVDLDDAIERVTSGAADVVFSATPSHSFLWRRSDGDDGMTGINHDRSHRPRRQDREPEYRETGAFYVMEAEGFARARHRFFGRVDVQVVPERHGIEIDTPADLELARAVAAIDEDGSVDYTIPVDAVVTDFDGVHTDDTAIVDAEGRESVRVSRADGHGVRLLREAGIPMLILSAERNAVVAARAEKLRVEVIHGVDGDDARGDKGDVLRAWSEREGIPLSRIAYLGNDVGDLPALDIVGWPIAVADARPEVRAVARVVLAHAGGTGAVRELADRVIAACSTGPTSSIIASDTPGASSPIEERRSS